MTRKTCQLDKRVFIILSLYAGGQRPHDNITNRRDWSTKSAFNRIIIEIYSFNTSEIHYNCIYALFKVLLLSLINALLALHFFRLQNYINYPIESTLFIKILYIYIYIYNIINRFTDDGLNLNGRFFQEPIGSEFFVWSPGAGSDRSRSRYGKCIYVKCVVLPSPPPLTLTVLGKRI